MIKRAVYILIQCTWGFVQSLAGLIVMLLLGRQKHRFYRCACLTEYDVDTVPGFMKNLGCVSLGMFIFIGVKKCCYEDAAMRARLDSVASHEYGHTFQSLIFGPLYLLIVGVPSFIWCMRYYSRRDEYNARGISYYSRFPEKQATKYGIMAGKRKP